MKKLSVNFTKTEVILGWIYMVVQLLVLPVILQVGNELAGKPLSDATLNFCYFALNFLFVTIIFRKYLLENLKLFFRKPGRGFAAVGLGFVGYWGLNFAISMVIVFIYPEFNNVNDENISSLVQENFALTAIGTILMVPITEELLFRGLIFRGIYNKSKVWAYVISSIAFSLPHVIGYIGMYDPLQLLLCFLQYLPAGLCLGWAYTSADSIFAPVIMHTVINLFGVYAMRLLYA